MRNFTKNLIAVSAALIYLGTVLPLGTLMPVLVSSLPLERDFACANHGCGCETADQCQASCCCFPKAQVKPVKKSCCGSEDESESEQLVVFSGCTGGKAVVEASIKRLAPYRWLEPSVFWLAETPGAYGVGVTTDFETLEPEVPSPIPISC